MKTEIFTNFYTRYKLILFPLLVGIIAIALSFFVIYPQINKYLAGQKELKRLNTRVTRLETKTQNLETLDESTLKTQLDTALIALPEDKDLANLVGVIQKVAQETGVILVSLAVGPAGSEDQTFNPFGVNLELGGSRESVKNFINAVEKAPRVIKVSVIELNPTSASESASAVTVVNLFYAPAPREIGAVDAPLPTIGEDELKIITNLKEANASSPTDAQPLGDAPKGKVNPFE